MQEQTAGYQRCRYPIVLKDDNVFQRQATTLNPASDWQIECSVGPRGAMVVLHSCQVLRGPQKSPAPRQSAAWNAQVKRDRAVVMGPLVYSYGEEYGAKDEFDQILYPPRRLRTRTWVLCWPLPSSPHHSHRRAINLCTLFLLLVALTPYFSSFSFSPSSSSSPCPFHSLTERKQQPLASASLCAPRCWAVLLLL